jgi:hypothetical protein
MDVLGSLRAHGNFGTQFATGSPAAAPMTSDTRAKQTALLDKGRAQGENAAWEKSFGPASNAQDEARKHDNSVEAQRIRSSFEADDAKPPATPNAPASMPWWSQLGQVGANMSQAQFGSQPMLSDERTKTPMAEANRAMAGEPYAYKPEFRPQDQAPGEANVGPMAQRMAQNPVSATAVRTDPRTGLMVVDQDKALKLTMAGVADLQRQNDELRAMLKPGGKKR